MTARTKRTKKQAKETDVVGEDQPSHPQETDDACQATSTKRVKRMVLCKKFLRDQCAFGERCKFSHDRKAFVCHAMHQKGRCLKGDACPYSHDAAQIREHSAKQQAAKQTRALEEQWKTEQGSLLRKLLRRDINLEQRKMLQMVRFLVDSRFLQDGDKDQEQQQEQQQQAQ
ncbi:hypothetical protein PINS_up012309 [Pythium insidiosum]|nr:hypothetical protein PINS_up012309 [Pythium insidiosum]